MLKKSLFILLLVAVIFSAAANNNNSNRFISAPSFIAINGNVGTVLPSCSFVSGDYAIPLYASQAIKYMLYTSANDWKHVAYGMPYYGLGLGVTEFGRVDDLGNPISLYLIQGATIKQINQRLAFNYELNLGVSGNWRPYDPFDNRENIAIGSETNAHVALNFYLKWLIDNRYDVHIGTSLYHASNGSSMLPNNGINAVSLYLEFTYNFNRKRDDSFYNPNIVVPEYTPHFEHDLQFIMSSKNIKADNDTPSGVNDHQFSVYGLNYYSMRAPVYRFKYGLGAELLYDESSNATITSRYSEIDDAYYQVTSVAPLIERMSLGLSFRGEMVMPHYSLFADVGYSIIQPDASAERFYQSLGVKVPLQNNIYGTFGVRLIKMSQAQFLYWSLGYTFNRKRFYRQ